MTKPPDENACKTPAEDGPGEAMLRWVKRKGLVLPATVLLEMHRPLMPLAWSAAMIFGAFLAPLFGPDYYRRIEALRDPGALDRILSRLREDGPEDAEA